MGKGEGDWRPSNRVLTKWGVEGAVAWIKIIGENEAQGPLKKIYDAAVQRAGKVFQILCVQSQNAPVLNTSLELYKEIMFGKSPLSRRLREMVAVVVSRANECHY